MRVSIALLGVFTAVACGGGEKKPAADTTTVVSSAPAPASSAPASMAPITGKTHEVHMMLDDKGMYRFDPTTLTAKVGDGVKFVLISGEPHNIAFDVATVPEDVRAQLAANIPNGTPDLMSPMLMAKNEALTISLGNIKPGTYGVFCSPHLPMSMKMELIVVP